MAICEVLAEDMHVEIRPYTESKIDKTGEGDVLEFLIENS